MGGFFKCASAYTRLLIGIGAVSFMPVTAIMLASAIVPTWVEESRRIEEPWDLVVALVGPALYVWAMSDIFQPRVRTEGVWGGPSAVEYQFCTTHPSYVLIDVMVIGWAAFLIWI